MLETSGPVWLARNAVRPSGSATGIPSLNTGMQRLPLRSSPLLSRRGNHRIFQASMAAMAASTYLSSTVSCSGFAPSSFVGSKDVGSVNSLAGGLRLPSVKALRHSVQKRRSCQGPSALFDQGNGTGSDGEKNSDKKKFITKEQEPEQYWQTAEERDGKNPMASPLPYILILGIASPFLILAVAFANNWIKIPVR